LLGPFGRVVRRRIAVEEIHSVSRVNVSRINVSRINVSRINVSRVNVSRINVMRTSVTRASVTRGNGSRPSLHGVLLALVAALVVLGCQKDHTVPASAKQLAPTSNAPTPDKGAAEEPAVEVDLVEPGDNPRDKGAADKDEPMDDVDDEVVPHSDKSGAGDKSGAADPVPPGHVEKPAGDGAEE
jgi:hypothetical protein